jgi:glycosyltransferase involved in cell wall biosynthesis
MWSTTDVSDRRGNVLTTTRMDGGKCCPQWLKRQARGASWVLCARVWQPMTPLFSVIVPTYDRPTYLREAVESVLSQSISDLEVIVIDDGSPTPLGDLADERVRVIHHVSNHGPAAARNSGLEAATGRYITFLDDDDLYLPDRLEITLQGLERAPIVVCWSRWMDEPGRPGRRLDGDVSREIAANLVPHLGTTTLERSVARRFDEAFDAVQDVDWWIQTARDCRLTTVPQFTYLIRRHSTPRHRNDLDARIRCTRLLFEKHAGYFARNPRAAAFRWKRLGLYLAQGEEYDEALKCFVRSFRLAPDPRIAAHLVRTFGHQFSAKG